jgi:hypothetical protein
VLPDLLERQQQEAENGLNDLKEKHAGEVEALTKKIEHMEKVI